MQALVVTAETEANKRPTKTTFEPKITRQNKGTKISTACNPTEEKPQFE